MPRLETEPIKYIIGITDEGHNVEIEETSQLYCSIGNNIMSVLEMVDTADDK
jgi:hypothetical protein